MWRDLGQSLRSIRKNRVRNGSWAFEQIKCNHQVQISKIDQNRTFRGAKIFLRILTQILGFLTQILGFLTHSYAVLFCSQPGFWAALIFLRILLGFLTPFLGFQLILVLSCQAPSCDWIAFCRKENEVWAVSRRFDFFLCIFWSGQYFNKSNQILKRKPQRNCFTRSFGFGLSSKASSESGNFGRKSVDFHANLFKLEWLLVCQNKKRGYLRAKETDHQRTAALLACSRFTHVSVK